MVEFSFGMTKIGVFGQDAESSVKSIQADCQYWVLTETCRIQGAIQAGTHHNHTLVPCHNVTVQVNVIPEALNGSLNKTLHHVPKYLP